jgi:hypothetical protein
MTVTGAELSLRALEEIGALTPVGLRLTDPELAYDQYEAVGGLLANRHKSLQWAIGDWLLLGENLYGHEAYQAHEVLGMSPEGRSQYLRCASVFPLARRRVELSWSHHRTVIALEPEEQDRWLGLAIQNGWANYEMAEHLRQERGPVNHGRGASNLNREFAPPAEDVEDAAREVVYHASEYDPQDGGETYYLVPAETVQRLARALGIDLHPTALVTSGEREEAA